MGWLSPWHLILLFLFVVIFIVIPVRIIFFIINIINKK
jgi:hypothetical protein